MTPPSPPRAVQSAPPGQSGSILISLAGALLLLTVLVGSIQIGYAYYQERELQKAADLAALSGVQVLSIGDCEKAKARAFEIAQGNDPDLNPDEVVSACGRWEAAQSPQPFADGATPYNALKTKIIRKTPTLIPFITQRAIQVHATALATEPVAAFSVGSRLLSLNSTGLLASILTAAGLDPNLLNVLDAAGVANIDITPSGLLQALNLPPTVLAGIGTPDQLARVTQLDIADLLTASFDLVSRSTAVANHIDAAQGLLNLVQGLSPLNVPIKLIGEHGVLAKVDAARLDSALNTHLNLMDILSTSILLANGKNLTQISLPATPLLGNALTASIQIVEPPTLAVGGRGTVAHSAQIRIYLRVKTNDLTAAGPLLGTLVSADLPIIIDVARSSGTLTNICEPPLERNQARIEVKTALVDLCVGKFQGMASSENAGNAEFLTAQNACAGGNKPEPYTWLKALGIPIKGAVQLPLFSSVEPPFAAVLAAPPATTATVKNPNNLDLVGNVSALSGAIVGGLLGELTQGAGLNMDSTTRKSFATELVGPGSGRLISTVVNEMQWSASAMNDLSNRLGSSMTGVLGGTLSLVGNVLNSLLLAPVNDLLCTPAGIFGETAIRNCRIDGVQNLLFSPSNVLGSTLSLVVALLTPILTPLDTLLNGLLNTLGLNLGETDVTLHSVQCGVPRLVE